MIIRLPERCVEELERIQREENEYMTHLCNEKLHALWKWGFPLPDRLAEYNGFNEPRVPYTITFYEPDELVILVDGRDYTFRAEVV